MLGVQKYLSIHEITGNYLNAPQLPTQSPQPPRIQESMLGVQKYLSIPEITGNYLNTPQLPTQSPNPPRIHVSVHGLPFEISRPCMRMSTEQTTEQFNIAMPPDVWGPIFWDAMHIVSLAYPVQPTEADKAGARSFFESLVSVIPCPICREHYSAKIKDSPIALESKGELIYWVWDIHNQVNTMLNKPTVTIEQFMERMRTLGSIRGTKPAPNPLHIGLGVVVGIAVGAGAFWAYQKYAKGD